MDRFNTFTILIASISRSISKIKTEEMDVVGLKGTHVSCLYYLFKSDKSLTSKELCEIAWEDKAAISRAVDYLENNGYISCETKFEKKYNSKLYLTTKGVKIAEFVSQRVGNILDEASSGLSEENREIFYNSLSLISKNLEKICKKYGG